MPLPGFQPALIFVAGFAAAVVNSIAGGGTLITFPILLWAGRDPIVANATNSLALWPGALASAIGFRREIAQAPRLLAALLPVSLAGGLVGAGLLIHTPSPTFSAIAPYLILLATALVALQRPLVRLLRPGGERAPSRGRTAGLAVWQLLVSIYGGYFGPGMGILMIAALGLYGVADIHQRNGLKSVLGTVINGVAGLYFVGAHAVDWTDALLLATGGIVGGYAGAATGRRLGRVTVERIVVAIGIANAIALIVKRSVSK